MRIKTENLKPVYKVWNQIRVKGSPLYENVFLDFENKTIGFKNEQATVKASLELEDNDGKGLEHRPMFVDGSKFFSLVQFYDYVDLSDDDIFYSSMGDAFQIPELEAEEVELADQEYDDWSTYSVSFTPELNKKLSLSFGYVDASENSDFSALFIRLGSLIACTRFKMFIAETDNGLEEADFGIPLPLLRLINSMGMQGTVDLKIRDNVADSKMIEFTYGDIWIRYGASGRYVLPIDPESEDFHSTYDFPTYFSVNLAELDGATKFLASYFSDVPSAICRMEFNTEDEDAMTMTLHVGYESSGFTDYKVKITSCSDPEYFNGKSGAMYLSYIRNAINIFSQYSVEEMRITFDEDAPALGFFDAKEETPVFVVHTALVEDL